jgi:hypothetical protein
MTALSFILTRVYLFATLCIGMPFQFVEDEFSIRTLGHIFVLFKLAAHVTIKRLWGKHWTRQKLLIRLS